jgi:hypothetical protein
MTKKGSQSVEMAFQEIAGQIYSNQTRIEYWPQQMFEWWSHCFLILNCSGRRSSRLQMNLVHYKQIAVQVRAVKAEFVSRKFSVLGVVNLN